MHNVSVTIVSAQQATLAVGPHSGPFPLPQGSKQLTLRVILDNSVIEAFAGAGRAVVSHRVYPGKGDTRVYAWGSAPVAVASFEGYQLRKPTPPSMEELEAVAAAWEARP